MDLPEEQTRTAVAVLNALQCVLIDDVGIETALHAWEFWDVCWADRAAHPLLDTVWRRLRAPLKRKTTMGEYGHMYTWLGDRLHSYDDLPSDVYRYHCLLDGTPDTEPAGSIWHKYGLIHRENDLPAHVHDQCDEEWYCRGVKHRDSGGPAVVGHGCRVWYHRGEVHRGGGLPAVVYPGGRVVYYVRGVRQYRPCPAYGTDATSAATSATTVETTDTPAGHRHKRQCTTK